MKTLQKLAQHNLRIEHPKWKVSKLSDELLESPTGDVWEIRDGKEKGEQLFTWDAAMRESKKQGKRIPTDEEMSELIKKKKDIPNLVLTGHRGDDGTFYGRGVHTNLWSSKDIQNLVLTGHRGDDGTFYGRGVHTNLWSSIESVPNAWVRHLNSGNSTVYQYADSKAYGFSVRCLVEYKITSKKVFSKKPVKIQSAVWKDDDARYEDGIIRFHKVGENGYFTPESLELFIKKGRRVLTKYKKLKNSNEKF